MNGRSTVVALTTLLLCCTRAARAPEPADTARTPLSAPPEGVTVEETDPPPFLSEGCPAGEHDVRTWNRISPSDVTTDQRFSLNDSPCTWRVSVRDGKVVATPHKDARPAVRAGFILPDTWGLPTAVASSASGVLFGFNRGEWGGALLWYSADGRFVKKLLDDDVVTIVPRGNTLTVFAGLNHFCLDDGRAIELVDARDAFHVERSVELGSAPRVIVTEADGALLIAASRGLLRLTPDLRVEVVLATHWGMFAPVSVAVGRDGTVYVGMRGVVAEVRLTSQPPSETWLSPVALPASNG